MGRRRILLVVLLFASTGLLSAEQPGGEIEKRKPIPKEVKEADADYADTILEAIQILSNHHVKKATQPQLTSWAIRGLYERIGERVPGEIARRLLALREPNEEDLRDLLKDVRQRLGNRTKLAEFRDMDLSLEGIFEHLEPGTIIRPLREERMICRLLEQCPEIGVQVCKDKTSGFLRVVTPIKDSPAYKAGIRAGDVIARIVRENEDDADSAPHSVSTSCMSIEQANELLCGKPGSKVRLIVYRNDPTKPRDVAIVRGWYDREALFGPRRKADDTWEFMLDPQEKIAYVRITEFTNRTQRELSRTLAALEPYRIKGMILDLRGNPGGLLTGTLDCANLFLDKGSLVVTFRSHGEKDQRIVTESSGRFRGISLVCLIDAGTGGSSEMFAACLQDHHRAVLIGERSRGDADVRRIVNLQHGDLQFAAVAFYRPNGKPLSKVVTSGKENDDWGVRPDEGFVVKLTPPERKELDAHLHRLQIIAPNGRSRQATKPAFRDRQLGKALEHLRNQPRHARP